MSETENKPLLDVENLTVRFEVSRGGGWGKRSYLYAVDDVSFTVKRGETLAVVGESGSGKTTLALAVLRLIASEGQIAFEGNDIRQWSVKELRRLRKDMQIVFQDPFGSLSPRMTCAQIIAEGLSVPRRASDRPVRALVAEVMDEVGLNPATMDRYPHEFSGGQRQRIAIALSLIHI